MIFLSSVLTWVAFVNLMGRKIHKSAQSRRGPNLVGFLGVFQPFSDRLKVLTKEKRSCVENSLLLSCSPFLINLFAQTSVPLRGLGIRRGLLRLLLLKSLGGVPIFLTGWNETRRYFYSGWSSLSSNIVRWSCKIFLAKLCFFRLFFSNTTLCF